MKKIFLAALLLSGSQLWSQTSFGTEKVLSTSADAARAVYASDLDLDGDLDVLSASLLDDKVAWYENLGSGTFSAEQIVSTGADHVTAVYATDLDGDGDPDVVICSFLDNKVGWIENLGAGVFSALNLISTSQNGASAVYAIDLDGDSDADIIASSFVDDKVSWYENMGGGLFSTENIITSSADSAWFVYAADIDGDGDNDVLSASSGDDKISWYPNSGTGSFGAQQVISTLANGPFFVHADDVDSDGDIDVLSASQYDDEIAWYPNLGGGLFGTQQVISNSIGGARSVFTGDFDNDGDIDVVAGGQDDDKISWFENTGAAVFGTENIISTNADLFRMVYAADLDGDSDIDILSASSNDDKIAWYQNNLIQDTLPCAVPLVCTSVLGINTPTLLDDVNNDPFGMALGDINGDGFEELVYASEGAGNIVQIDMSGLTTFLSTVIDAPGNTQDVELADLDNDGDLDLVAGVRASNEVVWYENTGTSIDPSSKTTIITGASGIVDIETADLDADGFIDVIAAATFSNDLIIVKNIGGVFNAPIIHDANAASIRSVSVADINSDGLPDLITANKNENNIVWYPNTGAFTFGTELIAKADLVNARNAEGADLDNDGDIDLIALDGNGELWALYNEGTGGFTCINKIDDGITDLFDLDMEDLNGDGFVDMLIVNSAGNDLIYFENDGTGTFCDKELVRTDLKTPREVEIGDPDGDGEWEFFTSEKIDDKVNLWGTLDPIITACNLPTALSSIVASTGAMLSWTLAPNHLGVQVKGRKVGDPVFGTIQIPANMLTVGGLTTATTYQWKLRAKCIDGTVTSFTPDQFFTTLSPRAASPIKILSVQPNPASLRTTINWIGFEENAALKIVDLTGKVHLTKTVNGTNHLDLNLNEYAAGVYFVSITANSGQQTEALIIE